MEGLVPYDRYLRRSRGSPRQIFEGVHILSDTL